MSGNFKSDASKWRTSDLSRLGIFYDNTETQYLQFMSMLRLGPGHPALSELVLPREYNLVVHCTRNIWDFSFDFDLRNHANTNQIIIQGKQDAARILQRLQDIQKKHKYQTTNQYHR